MTPSLTSHRSSHTLRRELHDLGLRMCVLRSRLHALLAG
jgi:hypothetical protein